MFKDVMLYLGHRNKKRTDNDYVKIERNHEYLTGKTKNMLTRHERRAEARKPPLKRKRRADDSKAPDAITSSAGV